MTIGAAFHSLAKAITPHALWELLKRWRAARIKAPSTWNSRVIFVGTHHKTGTVLFANIFKAIANDHALNFYTGSQQRLPPETKVWFNEHSYLYPRAFREIVGVHVIRHPLEVIASAYRYHLRGEEAWFASPASGVHYNLNGLSYQQKLSALSIRDGILFEMSHHSYSTIMDMYAWDYQDSRFLNVKLEDVMAAFDETLTRVFTFMGFDPSRCLPVARRYDLKRLDSARIAKIRHVTNVDGGLTWKNYFCDEEMIDQFRKKFPEDLLPKLGYSLE